MTPERYWAGTPSSPATWNVASDRGRSEPMVPVVSACATAAGCATELAGAAGRAGLLPNRVDAERATAAPRAAATTRNHADRRSMDHLCGTVATALIGLSFRSGCRIGSDGRTVGLRAPRVGARQHRPEVTSDTSARPGGTASAVGGADAFEPRLGSPPERRPVLPEGDEAGAA